MDGTLLVAKLSETPTFIPNAFVIKANLRMAFKMKSKFIGPTPPQMFLGKFLPITDLDASILVPEGFATDIYAYEPVDITTVKTVTDFSFVEIHVKLEKNDDDNGFFDNGLLFSEDSTNHGGDTRGKIIGYATAQLGLQFRPHVFSVLLCGSHARIIHWDRRDALVSSKVNYVLLQFPWRCSKLSSEAPGKDLSVLRPTAVEVLEARVELEFNYEDILSKYMVLDGDLRELCFFRGNEPGLKADSSATSQATFTLPGMRKEGVISKPLQEYCVPHISNTWRSGDVLPVQSTGLDKRSASTLLYATADYIMRKPNGEKIKGRKSCSHYRIVLDIAGNNLTTFKSSKELITAARDALEALFAAYHNAGVMHRDVSCRNIMITNKGGGLLLDWDLAKAFMLSKFTPEPIPGPIRQVERSGTWQFMSVRLLLTTATVAHTLADDMESMLHVLSWIALRYMPHGLDFDDLVMTLYSAFDARHKEGAQWRGNRSKKTFLTGREIGGIGLEDRVVAKLLTELAYVFAVRYEPEPPKQAFEKFKELEKNKSWNEYSDRDRDLAFDARRYTRRKKQLQDPAWMLEMFNNTLAKGPWLPNDAVNANDLPAINDKELKRKDPDDAEENDCAKRQRRCVPPSQPIET